MPPSNTIPAAVRPISAPRLAGSDSRALEFPGCLPFTLRREDLEDHDRRFEYWDGDTETAWEVREPTSAAHESPSQVLTGLVELIAQTRGSPIRTFGTMDLTLRDRYGLRQRIMQADQCVYVNPDRVWLPLDGPELVVGRHAYPDVVLEVDNTTDVRRGKQWLYEAWGFPELWVEVPEAGYAVRRPNGLLPGLTIHVLEDGAYRTVAESRAFPGWTANDIHIAMNEQALSSESTRILRGVARTLGSREGTPADGLPWLRMEREEARAEGRIEGRAEGRAEGERALVEMAALRFDAETAARLLLLLARLDAAHLAEAGKAIIVCATAAELLDRVAALARA